MKKEILRITWFTLAWIIFPPLFFIKNREITNSIQGKSMMHAFFVNGSKDLSKIISLWVKLKVLTAISYFWGHWNPAITYETTRPLYKICKGNRYPFLATIVCFIYSGIFLHNIMLWNILIKWVIRGEIILTFSWFSFFLYFSFGIISGLSNYLRYQKLKSKEEKKFDTYPALKFS